VELSDLKDILRMLEEQDITEFELEQDGVKLRICRSRGSSATVGAPPAVVVAPPEAGGVKSAPAGEFNAGGPVSAPTAPAEASAPPAGSVSGEDGSVIQSPIVGTFYRAPDPNSPPFVNVGDRVEVGQVLCIIEAMKLMNEIEAEMSGEILKIHPQNGQPVQYGDALFTIRPS
jgi:acetyl-CoA carboxylase biotin carboxyl carrier protein